MNPSFLTSVLLGLLLGFQRGASSSIPSEEATTDVDLKAVLSKPLILQPEVYNTALKAIEALQREPSCHRLAAAALIESCRALDKIDTSSPQGLDHTKSLFAARLAVCELRTAHATVPEQCQQLLPYSPSSSKSGWFSPFSHPNTDPEYPAFENKGPEMTSRCLSVLESRPQWWTSYSNARQTAVSICHVSRREVDLANDLDTYRDALRIFSELGLTAKHSIEEELERIRQYARAATHLQQRLREEMTSTSLAFSDMASSALEWLRSFFSSIQQLDTTLVGINKTAMSTLKDVKIVQDRFQQFARNVTGASDRFAAHMLSSHDALLKKTTEVQNAVVGVQERNIAALTESVSALAIDLTTAEQLATKIQNNQERSVELAARVEENFQGVDEYVSFFQRLMAELAMNATVQLDGIHLQVANISGTIEGYHGKLESLGIMIDRQAAVVSTIGFGKQVSLLDLFVVVLVGTLLIRFNSAYMWASGLALGCVYFGLTTAPSHMFTTTLVLLRFWPSLAALSLLAATTAIGVMLVARRSSKMVSNGEKTITSA